MQFNKHTNDNTSQARSSTKRPRAPVACYRCHHKKVRCDGIRPNCTRCLSTGILCAYPSSRRSRNTQPSHVDPFINNLSGLEAKIRRIESDLESQRELVQSICGKPNDAPNTNILQTKKNLQDSSSVVAQLRVHGDKQTKSGVISSSKNPMELTTNNYDFIDNSLIPYNNSNISMMNNSNGSMMNNSNGSMMNNENGSMMNNSNASMMNNSNVSMMNNSDFQDWMMNTERNLFDESFFYQNILTPFLPDKNQAVLTSEIYNEPYLT